MHILISILVIILLVQTFILPTIRIYVGLGETIWALKREGLRRSAMFVFIVCMVRNLKKGIERKVKQIN